MIETPILILVFNRPDKIKLLLNELKLFKPIKIYIGADGPRNQKEMSLTNEVRKIIDNSINWECDVFKLYREENLGLRVAVSQSITWFFENEDAGIILEDDCLPSSAFFKYADTLLKKHYSDHKIFHISGNNLRPTNDHSYHLSKYPRVWGWATWKRAWKSYDDSDDFISQLTKKQIKKMFPRAIDRAFWSIIIDKMKLPNGTLKRRSWAYFWALNIRSQQGYAIQPEQNLIHNVGFSLDSTNTKADSRLERLSSKNTAAASEITVIDYPSYQEEKDNDFVDNILIESRMSYFKIIVKIIFPFLKPRH